MMNIFVHYISTEIDNTHTGKIGTTYIEHDTIGRSPFIALGLLIKR